MFIFWLVAIQVRIGVHLVWTSRLKKRLPPILLRSFSENIWTGGRRFDFYKDSYCILFDEPWDVYAGRFTSICVNILINIYIYKC